MMGSDCIVDVSESASQGNTVEMFSAPTITEDSKSYTTYDRRSIEDFDYRPYDVSTRARIHTRTHAHVDVRNVETYLHTQTCTLSHKHLTKIKLKDIAIAVHYISVNEDKNRYQSINQNMHTHAHTHAHRYSDVFKVRSHGAVAAASESVHTGLSTSFTFA